MDLLTTGKSANSALVQHTQREAVPHQCTLRVLHSCLWPRRILGCTLGEGR